MNADSIEVHLQAVGFFERLAVAVALGLIIGFERQWRQRTGGLHIVTLVCVGSCLFTILTPLLNMSGDRTRMAAAVVSGIGFLAGSVILKEGLNIRGLITAATLWSTAAVGILIGFGFYVQGTVGALTVTAVNYLLQPLVDVIARNTRPHIELTTLYTVTMTCAESARVRLRDALLRVARTSSLEMRSLTSVPTATDGTIEMTAEVGRSGYDDNAIEGLVAAVRADPEVSRIHWKIVEEGR